ncbi:hypothetical protein [Streptomyces sp. SYSU K21746]
MQPTLQCVEEPVGRAAALGPRPATRRHNLVVVGFDEIVANKYLPCIKDAIEDGHVDSYSVIDLESERPTIEERIQEVDLKPREVIYLPESRRGVTAQQKQSELIRAALRRLRLPELPVKVYIATEVRAHEAYLRYCVENGIDSLMEKPVLAPLADGRFAPSCITETMRELIAQAGRTDAKHFVMTLSRYHRIYNGEVLRSLEERVRDWQAPVTSFHLRAAGEELRVPVSARFRALLTSLPADIPRRAVDLGYGAGAYTIALAEAGFTVVAVDQAPAEPLLRRLSPREPGGARRGGGAHGSSRVFLGVADECPCACRPQVDPCGTGLVRALLGGADDVVHRARDVRRDGDVPPAAAESGHRSSQRGSGVVGVPADRSQHRVCTVVVVLDAAVWLPESCADLLSEPDGRPRYGGFRLDLH